MIGVLYIVNTPLAAGKSLLNADSFSLICLSKSQTPRWTVFSWCRYASVTFTCEATLSVFAFPGLTVHKAPPLLCTAFDPSPDDSLFPIVSKTQDKPGAAFLIFSTTDLSLQSKTCVAPRAFTASKLRGEERQPILPANHKFVRDTTVFFDNDPILLNRMFHILIKGWIV